MSSQTKENSPTCPNCIHSIADLSNKELVYKCRRYPPDTHILPQQSAMGVSIATICVWPQVTKNDRCGEYQGKLDPLTEHTNIPKILV